MDGRLIASLGVAALLITAGCIGGNGEPTPTADPTVTATGTVTAAPTTTTTPEPTDTAAPTTTTTAPTEPNPTVSVQSVPDTVRDGTATVEVRIENHGGAGAIPWTLQLDREQGEFYDTTWNGTAEVGPNGIATRSVAIDFRATGEYQLSVNGQAVGTVDVQSLGHTGGESDAERAPPVIEVSVSGESVVG